MVEHEPLPFATATIARLYMLQGRLDQAEALYRKLLQERPDDLRLASGLAETLRRIEAERTPISGDGVSIQMKAGELLCIWCLSEEGQCRAQRILGEPGRLVLRLVAFPVDPARPPQDLLLEDRTGELVLPPPGSLVAASVGVLSTDGRFASIAHCRPISPRMIPE